MGFSDQLTTYIKAVFPLISIETVELERATEAIKEVVHSFNVEVLPKSSADDVLKSSGLGIAIWDCHRGWVDLQDKPLPKSDGTAMPIKALEYLLAPTTGSGVYILNNFHFVWSSSVAPQCIQILREIFHQGRLSWKYVIALGANTKMPLEIQQYFASVDFPLPDVTEVKNLLSTMVEDMGFKVSEEELNEVPPMATGMTSIELWSAACTSLMKTKGQSLDKHTIMEEKIKAVKRSGYLEFIPTNESLDTIGGLTNLKDWFTKVAMAFKERDRADKYHLPVPKGCLIAGIPGTGKTLSAKVIANMFGVPLLRWDIGKVFGGIVGQTEENTRQALKLIDAVSPCVVLIDEAEKLFAGLKSSDTSDAGVTARFIGNVLYYLQEKTSLSFFVFTVNDVTLPSALLRRGRIDELWFVDLPREIERLEILKIQLKKVERDPDNFDLAKLTKISDGYTGAEIESAIKAALYNAFFEDREVTTADIMKSISETTSITETKSEEIEALRRWQVGRARLANSDNTASLTTKRKKKIIVDGEKEHWENETCTGRSNRQGHRGVC